MKAIINFQVIEDFRTYPFGGPFTPFIQENFCDFSFYDLDQFSDQDLFEYGKSMIEAADRVLLIIGGSENTRPDKLYLLQNLIMAGRDKSFVLSTIRNEVVDEYFSELGDHYCVRQEEDMQKRFITAALSDQR